ncbi:glutathione S-transferase [Xylariaceae sp. FL0255]|nr:glutathione S-transferase [Xylariaceae sp. FL0255]
MATPNEITLYTEGTPNGLKASIALEELGLDYKVRSMKLYEQEQKEPWFLAINPNGRIPALTAKAENGEELKIFESGAILEYLVATYDKDHKISYPYGSKEHWETVSWLMWQMGGIGPIQGQANHFFGAAPEKIEYAINRYVNESRRLYRVMDAHLANNPHGYLVGDRLTIADIAVWPWTCGWKSCGLQTMEEFPHVQKWMQKLLERPGFERGRNVPAPHYHLELNKLPEEEVVKLMRTRSAWVLEAMKKDADA